MTIEGPMFPSRAESVDSFSLQSAIGQRADETVTLPSRPATSSNSPTAFPAACILGSSGNRETVLPKNGLPKLRPALTARPWPTSQTEFSRQADLMTGAQFEEFVNCMGEQQQAFITDVWKLLNRHFRKL
jgi:hypothetical protein